MELRLNAEIISIVGILYFAVVNSRGYIMIDRMSKPLTREVSATGVRFVCLWNLKKHLFDRDIESDNHRNRECLRYFEFERGTAFPALK